MISILVCNFLFVRNDEPIIETPECPQQRNGNDCGVFLLLFSEYIISKLTNCQYQPQSMVDFPKNDMMNFFSPSIVDSFRLKMLSKIKDLKSE